MKMSQFSQAVLLVILLHLSSLNVPIHSNAQGAKKAEKKCASTTTGTDGSTVATPRTCTATFTPSLSQSHSETQTASISSTASVSVSVTPSETLTIVPKVAAAPAASESDGERITGAGGVKEGSPGAERDESAILPGPPPPPLQSSGQGTPGHTGVSGGGHDTTVTEPKAQVTGTGGGDSAERGGREAAAEALPTGGRGPGGNGEDTKRGASDGQSTGDTPGAAGNQGGPNGGGGGAGSSREQPLNKEGGAVGTTTGDSTTTTTGEGDNKATRKGDSGVQTPGATGGGSGGAAGTTGGTPDTKPDSDKPSVTPTVIVKKPADTTTTDNTTKVTKPPVKSATAILSTIPAVLITSVVFLYFSNW